MKICKTAVAASALTALALTGCGGGQTASDEITLKVSDWYPKTHTGVTEGSEYWMNLVEEGTDGKVKFEHYPAEQLGKSSDFLNLVQTGVADVALLGTAYYPSQLHLSSIGSLPGMFTTSCEGTEKFWNVTKPGSEIAENELADQDIVPLYVGVTPSYEILTSKKKIEKPADTKGTKLRSSGGTYDEVIESIGSSPVTISASEQYEAISRGTVDGAVFTYATAEDYSLEEVIKYGTNGAQMGAFTAIEGISSDVWKNIPEEYQKVMLEAGEKTNNHLCKKWDELNDSVIEDMKKQGITITDMTNEQTADWIDATSQVQKNWVDASGEAKNRAQEILDEFAKSDG